MASKRKNAPRHKLLKVISKACWIALLSFVIIMPLYVYAVSINAFGLFGGMPSLKTLENPKTDLSSELISSDGESLGRYFIHNRSQVVYDELSNELVTTLLTSEDHKFMEHSGIYLKGLIRAIVGVITGKYIGGGSTLTMQLAENLFQGQTETNGKLLSVPFLGGVVIKTKEWIIASHLEKSFTKNELIAMYLNTVTFGNRSFGIKSASENYFDKQPIELNYNESAVLVGILQANTLFNPIANYDNSIKKRNQIFGKLKRHNHISQNVFDSLKAAPIDVSKFQVLNQNTGIAPYLRSALQADLLKWCKENGYNLYEDGLKIYTTIDSRAQVHAREAVAQRMTFLQKQFNKEWGRQNPWRIGGEEIPDFLENEFKKTDYFRSLAKRFGANSKEIWKEAKKQKRMKVFTWKGEVDTLMSSMDSINHYMRFLHTGLMSVEPSSGKVKAWVGGISHKHFKYDHVRQSKRQPGSTFKAFVYGKAIEDKWTPCHEFADIPITFQLGNGKTWRVKNAGGKDGTGNVMTMRQGMARSVNTIAAAVMEKIGGPEKVAEFAHRMGIKSELNPVPSLCLGTSPVSLYELVGAYSTFANQGRHIEPYCIERIVDKNGNVLKSYVPTTKQAISPETAYIMLHMLKGGVEEEGGTSFRLSNKIKSDNEIGGKTGTTNNAADGWYVGVAKDLVTGIWVGGERSSIHFKNWQKGSGAYTARPIWEKYMLSTYADKELFVTKGPFKQPQKGLDIELDCEAYQ